MSFLGRAAARASATPSAVVGAAPPTAVVAVPAMVSTSPIVALDQRLTLPGFSEIAPIAQTPSGAIGELGAIDAPSSPEGESPAPASSAAAGVGVRGAAGDAGRPPVVGHGAVGPASAFSPLGIPSTSTVAVDPGIAASLGSLRSDVPKAPGLDDARRVSGESRERTPFSAFTVASSSESPDATARRVALSAARGRAAPDLEPSGPQAAAARIAMRDGALLNPEPGAGEAPAELGPKAHAVLDAMARLDAWMRADAADFGAPPSAEAGVARGEAVPSSPGVPLMAPAPRFEAAESTSFAAAPVISIGKLEIEVVPPTPKARWQEPNRAPERRARSASRGPSAVAVGTSRSFGWRQR